MNLFIEIYIILCVALLIFDLVFLAAKNFKNYEFYPRNPAFEERLRREILQRRETGSFSDSFTKELPRLLEKTKNLITLQTELEKDPEASEWFRTTVYALIETYQKKTDYEQAYYLYFISTFDYSKEPVSASFSEHLMSFLDSKSLYTFSNTMNVLYRIGQVNLMVMAIDKADERGKFYHKKLLLDGILASNIDLEELTVKLVGRFRQYSPHMQDCILDVFRMGKGDASGLCMELIQDTDTDEQVRYSAMRYFIKHPAPQSREFFLNILENESSVWIEQMLAIQGLSRYDDNEVYHAIKRKATSYHWHVRTNAVEYLHRQGISREELSDILRTQDKYASEALLYQYRDDHEMTLFIIQTIQAIAQETASSIPENCSADEDNAVAAEGVEA